MVFTKFTYLARPGISKAFIHGYAQSVVAATQTSGPFPPLKQSSNNKPGRRASSLRPSPLFNIVGSAPGSSCQGHTEGETLNPGGLAAYYEAWQNLQTTGGDATAWKQFQFPKLIEGKSPNKCDESKELSVASPDPQTEQIELYQRHATVVDVSLRSCENDDHDPTTCNSVTKLADSAVEGSDNVAKTKSIRVEHLAGTNIESIACLGEGNPKYLAHHLESSVPSSEPILTVDTRPESARASDLSADDRSLLDHIEVLLHTQAYDQIPKAFESLLNSKTRPNNAAYNALLLSAIHLSSDCDATITKALTIYHDMISREILPDGLFCSTIVQILCKQTCDITDRADELAQSARILKGGLHLDLPDTDGLARSGDVSLDAALDILRPFLRGSTLENFSTNMYQSLILACARRQRITDMVWSYRLLESQAVTPPASIFPAMIEAFANASDLGSAIECYNEYRALAIEDDGGKFVLVGREDCNVYAAVINAFTICGKPEKGRGFFDKVLGSFSAANREQSSQLQEMKDVVNIKIFLQGHLTDCDFDKAWSLAELRESSNAVQTQAWTAISIEAASNGKLELARKAYSKINLRAAVTPSQSLAMFAMCVQQEALHDAMKYWNSYIEGGQQTIAALFTTRLFVTALVHAGHIDFAVDILCNSLTSLGISQKDVTGKQLYLKECSGIVEACASQILNDSAIEIQPGLNLLTAMKQANFFIPSVARQVLRGFRTMQIDVLDWKSLLVIAESEANILTVDEDPVIETNQLLYFGSLIKAIASTGFVVEEKLILMVRNAIRTILMQHPDAAAELNHSLQTLRQSYEPSLAPQRLSKHTSVKQTQDSHDPYAENVDLKGSATILRALASPDTRRGLSIAVDELHSMRGRGRHPRYTVYAKLITVAAKERGLDFAHEVLSMARSDISPIPGQSNTSCGWSLLLDAMMGACLNAGKRASAERFHEELRSIGTSPSANTFGLYITSLGDSSKTADEATEALKIFSQAVNEGVLPTSFLYNALIGKLGKARRTDDCLHYFEEMRTAGIRPTSVTYGTLVNALCRVSDEVFAEDLFHEMESMPNYKPRPAPYNSLMQFFLTTKKDSSKVLSYYNRMQHMKIVPTMHTYKLLIDTYATLKPIDICAAERVIETMQLRGHKPEAVHFASLIHAKGCILRDLEGAKNVFNKALRDWQIKPQACLYQALFESMVANDRVHETAQPLASMNTYGVKLTPYCANTLIHGWATNRMVQKSRDIYDLLRPEDKEPSTYEAMARAYMLDGDLSNAKIVAHEMLSRGYPPAVSGKIIDIIGHGDILHTADARH